MRAPIKQMHDAKMLMTNYKESNAIKYGKEQIEPILPKQFVSYPFMVAFMAVLQVLTVIFGDQMLSFFGFQVSSGWIFLMPIVIYIFQISAECYGWQYARQLVWINFLINATFAIILSLFSLIPTSDFYHSDIGYAYKALLLYETPSSISMLFCMFLADFITYSLICCSKFQFNGKYLAIRIAILHCIAEIVVLLGGITGLMVGVSLSEIWHFSVDSFLARSIVMILLLPVAKFVIWYIQHKVEGVRVFDLSIKFNPFKFSIDPNNSVQFSVSGKNEVNTGAIDMKKLAKAYSNLILEEQHKLAEDRIKQR